MKNFNTTHSNQGDAEIYSDVKDVYNELTRAGLDFWLMSGSALGAALAGKMLPGDRDIDLGMKKEDRYKLSIPLNALKKKGFVVIERYDPVNQEVKGMITIKRYVPFDIKLYASEGGEYWRALHKSHGFAAVLVWQCLDVAFFNKLPIIKIQKNILKPAFSSVFTAIVYVFSKNKAIRTRLINILSRTWRSLKVEYGYERLSRSWFDSFKSIDFCGCKFNVFGDLEGYLDSEYGNSWRENKKEYCRGGWAKYSHRVTSRYVFTGHR